MEADMEIKLQNRYKCAGDIFEALIKKAGFPIDVACEFLNGIKDAEVIEQMHGEWEYYTHTMMVCSICKRHVPRHKSEYCPHCGAKMDGGEK
jgi:hypothetical protein